MATGNGGPRRPNGHISRHRRIAAQLQREARNLHTNVEATRIRLAHARQAIAESRALLETMRSQRTGQRQP